jgi:hypothetical protein
LARRQVWSSRIALSCFSAWAISRRVAASLRFSSTAFASASLSAGLTALPEE